MDTEPQPFSFSQGGLLSGVLSRIPMLSHGGVARGVWLALITWAPMMAAVAIRALLGRPPAGTFYDLSVHTRLLVALPAMFLAEHLVEPAAASTIHTLYVGDFCDRSALNRAVERTEALSHLWWPEVLILAIAVIGGQLALWNVTGSTGVFHGGAAAPSLSFPRVWYVGFGLPLMQFVMLRWLWRWTIWCTLLARIAALPLRAVATHPDQAAGLSCLARPVSGFSAFAFAMGATLAGAWGTKLIAGSVTIQRLFPELLAFLVITLAVAVGPLLLFCGHLYRARRQSLAQYGDFAGGYVRAFHARWIAGRASANDALGASDIQSLADIGNAFGVISKTRLFAFSSRNVLAVWGGAALPMVPLLATTMTVEDLVKRILSAIFGGLPL